MLSFLLSKHGFLGCHSMKTTCHLFSNIFFCKYPLGPTCDVKLSSVGSLNAVWFTERLDLRIGGQCSSLFYVLNTIDKSRF